MYCRETHVSPMCTWLFAFAVFEHVLADFSKLLIYVTSLVEHAMVVVRFAATYCCEKPRHRTMSW